MKVLCTQNFIDCIARLAGNNSYSAVLDDVCAFLSDKDIQELHQMKDLLRITPGKYSLNKYRIKNSLTNKGKSSSYRCIAVCLPEVDEIYLDTIYPKTGSQGQENLDKERYKSIAKNVQASISGNELFELDVKTGQLSPVSSLK
ncbi:MAG: hypothetical protein JST90_01205 [Bacteroidetes bacterium]|nr:hypothetical protein [Bacteroidota bacterium]